MKCKICQEEMTYQSHQINTGHPENTTATFRNCSHLMDGHNYTVWIRDDNQTICREWLYINTPMYVYLEYHPLTKEAYIWLDNDDQETKISVAPIEELTSELAIQWLKRLKSYVVYS